jgi:hypothetical protein
MSTDLMTYLNYMSTWDSETDDNINKVIKEHQLFTSLGNFSSDAAIDAEFDQLTGLATAVRDNTIAADAIQIAADAAAVAAIWSFGLGMVAFAALEATEAIERKVISNKSKELNEKLKTVDTDISARISPGVNDYITQYKANNNLIASKAPSGLDTTKCRSILMQFMAKVERKHQTLDTDTFKKYAESARILFKSDEIQAVYDALDDLNLSDKSDADVKKFLSFLKGLELKGWESTALTIVRSVSIIIMAYKLNIANSTIKECAKAAELEVSEVESSAFGMMDAVGKFVAVVAIAMAVVDTVLDIIDIVDVVEQTKEMCTKLDGSIKQSYKDYFDGIKTASKKYNDAMAESAKA